MPYNNLMTRMDTGLMGEMTRGSLALRGTGEICFWHRQGNRAQGARAGREQPLPRSPRRLCCRPCRKSSCWPWSAPWPATPPAPIMPPSNRAEREPPVRSGCRVPTPHPPCPLYHSGVCIHAFPHRSFTAKARPHGGRTDRRSAVQPPDRAMPGHQQAIVDVAGAALDLLDQPIQVGARVDPV